MMSVWADLWNYIVAGLNWLLQGMYRLTGNYGVAIILLTILVKAVLLPLTIKQTRSMIAMQKIQPEIKKLQEKYKDDKEKLSQEMMKFYKENKINPLGGCLPLVLQLPVFIALFTVLRKYLLTPPTMIVGMTMNKLPGFYLAGGAIVKVVPKSAGFLWVKNLADTTRLADPTYILLALLIVTTWYSQKQVMTDPRQKNMLYIMPLITAFIGYSLPAGVVLYWLTTNALQIIQQFGMELYDKRHPEKAPQVKETKKAQAEKAAAREGTAKQKAQAAQGKAAAQKPAPKKGQAKAPAAKQKQKQQASGAPKGGGAKAKGAPQKGGSPQVRKPKGPPPQKKTQGNAPKKGGARKGR
jgi:YidC/Oxa1 family membrane protein insertase